MKHRILWLLLLAGLTGTAQNVTLSSLQHVVRWVSKAQFPNYFAQPAVQQSVLDTTAEALKKKFNAVDVQLPRAVDYRYILSFGKATLQKPSPGEGYRVSILSYITRATVGFAVLWKMELQVTQGGQTVFQKSTEHELEYFSTSGYTTQSPWMNEQQFIGYYTELINEALENREPLAAKIVIGSFDRILEGIERRGEEVKTLFAHPDRYIIKISGDFFKAHNFSLRLFKGDTLINSMDYKDGWEQASEVLSLSSVASGLLKEVTGLSVGYDAKVRQKRFGRLEYEDGRRVRLKMEWVDLVSKYNDEMVEITGSTPMVTEVYEGKELIGYFVYKTGSPALSYQLEGRLHDVPVRAEYTPETDLLTLTSGGQLRLVVLMANTNPESNSLNGVNFSKNKKLMLGSFNRNNQKKAEWYYVYIDGSIPAEEVRNYTELITFLFFGMGNAH